MPPPNQRSATLSAPKTASAIAARQSFSCDLCQKGYSRQNDFDAHEGSYDHQHRKRLKELKEMNRSMASTDASAKARKEEKKDGLIRVNLGAGVKKEGAGGFKKGGFKSAFGGSKEEDVGKGKEGVVKVTSLDEADETESENEGEEMYDPRKPTGWPPY